MVATVRAVGERDTIGVSANRDSHLLTYAFTAIKVTASALSRTRLSGQGWGGGSAELVAIRSVDRGWGADLPGAMVSPISDRHRDGSVAAYAAT